MSEKLHYRGLLAFLEQYGHRVSAEGLENDYPLAWKQITDSCLEKEQYEFLNYMKLDSRKEFDETFYIFISKKDKAPVIVEKKEYYFSSEYNEIAKILEVSKEKVQEFLHVTPAQ